MEAVDPNPDNMVECFDGVRRPRPTVDASVVEHKADVSLDSVSCRHCSDKGVVTLSNGRDWPCPKCLKGTWKD